jgi:hypothetical protein
MKQNWSRWTGVFYMSNSLATRVDISEIKLLLVDGHNPHFLAATC